MFNVKYRIYLDIVHKSYKVFTKTHILGNRYIHIVEKFIQPVSLTQIWLFAWETGMNKF